MLLINKPDSTWYDTAEAEINNWFGEVYRFHQSGKTAVCRLWRV
ncbi:MAG: hypothetical protein P8173_01880 [Gammaproteobacteria bacterium]